jgi:uncharacterized protein (DUF3820 family)
MYISWYICKDFKQGHVGIYMYKYLAILTTEAHVIDGDVERVDVAS